MIRFDPFCVAQVNGGEKFNEVETIHNGHFSLWQKKLAATLSPCPLHLIIRLIFVVSGNYMHPLFILCILIVSFLNEKELRRLQRNDFTVCHQSRI